MPLQNQPSYIIKMRAKPGAGEKLLELATRGMEKSGASKRYIILSEENDPDVLWCIEIFSSKEAKDRYENSPLADELRDEILDLLYQLNIKRRH